MYRPDLAECRDLMRAKRYDEAAARLESLPPGDARERFEVERRYLLGVCYRHLRRFPEALEQLESVQRADADHKQVLKELGRLLTHVDPTRAEIFLTGVLQSNPKDRTAWSLRAFARTTLGRYDDAMEDVMEALRLDPAELRWGAMKATLWDRLLSLGMRKLHERRRLRDFFAEMLAAYPGSKDAWRYFATFLRNIQEYAEAEDAYARAQALAPDDLEILRSVAHLYERAHAAEKEVQVLRRILELDPGDAKTRTRLDWIEALHEARRRAREARAEGGSPAA